MTRRLTLLFAALVVDCPSARGQVPYGVELDTAKAPTDNRSIVLTGNVHLKLPTSAAIAAEARHMQQRPRRDSLKNGTLAGMVIGALAVLVAWPVAAGCFGDNQGECDPGMTVVGAGIGAPIGAAIGVTVAALRSASPGRGLRVDNRDHRQAEREMQDDSESV